MQASESLHVTHVVLHYSVYIPVGGHTPPFHMWPPQVHQTSLGQLSHSMEAWQILLFCVCTSLGLQETAAVGLSQNIKYNLLVGGNTTLFITVL